MLGVCHTCHVPIYYGEPIHKLQTRDEERTYTGLAGGGYGGGVAGGGYRANSKKHSETEGWIQCGFCYGSWKEEVKKLEKWEKGWNIWGAIGGFPLAIIFMKQKTSGTRNDYINRTYYYGRGYRSNNRVFHWRTDLKMEKGQETWTW